MIMQHQLKLTTLRLVHCQKIDGHGSSNTIPLHSIVSSTQESIISNVNDEVEV